MANIVWEMPDFTPTGDNLKICVTDLNNKLLAIGLIDYVGNNTTNLNSIPGSFVADPYKSMKMIELNYKLPVGNGKTIFEDVPGTDYKKIINESYDSTEVYIKIIFYASNLYYSSVGYNSSNSSKYFIYTSEVYVSGNTEFTTYNMIDSTTLDISTSSPAYHNYLQGSKLCIINLTGNVFSILWHDGTQYSSDTNTSTYSIVLQSAPQLFFSIYRENNVITCNSRKWLNTTGYLQPNQSSSPYGVQSNSFHYLALYEIIVKNGANISYTQKYQGEYMRRIPDYAPYISETNATIFPIYMDLLNNMRINPGLCRIYVDSPSLPTYNTQLSMYDIITYHKGQKVKLKYYNASLIYHRLKTRKDLATNLNTINNKDCSYLVLLEDYPVTTESL